MSETCAVCKKGKGPEKCEVCGFSDNGFINRQFPIPEDAKNWIETVVKPYRLQWENTDLRTQLEAAKKREAELLAQLEAAKSNAVLHSPSAPNTFTDPRDGKVYRTVKIGEQVWMAENLAFVAEGSQCYDNDESNGKKYGRLYNWDTAMIVCPKGWHLPSDKEWQILVDFAGGEKIAGKKLKSKIGWNKNGNGTDDFGFSALPGGYGGSDGSCFYDVGDSGYWWSSSLELESNANYAYYRSMDYDYESVHWLINYKSYRLFSVRCLQD